MWSLSFGFLVWETELMVGGSISELGTPGGAPAGEVELAEIVISPLYPFDLLLNYLSRIFRGG